MDSCKVLQLNGFGESAGRTLPNRRVISIILKTGKTQNEHAECLDLRYFTWTAFVQPALSYFAHD
jgi:hypothetical protein